MERQEDLFHPNPKAGARTTDPLTSHIGARDVEIRAGTQRWELLMSYYVNGEMTDEEAGELSGLRKNRACCYWKRCSELREGGYIEVVRIKRNPDSGCEAQVCKITPKGSERLSFSQ